MFLYHGAAPGIDNPNIKAANDELGHNGSTQTYTLVCRLCYWKGLRLVLTSILNGV